MSALKQVRIDADVLTGRVTFTDGMRVEITFGTPPNPDAKFYIDGNPLGLKESDAVIVAVARQKNEESDSDTEQAKAKVKIR